MLKLIRLEWQKNNIGKYIRNAVILAVLLSIFMFALCYGKLQIFPHRHPACVDGVPRAFKAPDCRKIPERDILLETRKGVALSYAPTQIAM